MTDLQPIHEEDVVEPTPRAVSERRAPALLKDQGGSRGFIWGGRTRVERALITLALLALILAPLSFPLTRALSPSLAVKAQALRQMEWLQIMAIQHALPAEGAGGKQDWYHQGSSYAHRGGSFHLSDPWDKPWIIKAEKTGGRILIHGIWATGPNGVYDQGSGDDIAVGDIPVHFVWPAAYGHNIFPWIAASLLWLAFAPYKRAGRSQSAARELKRIAILASGPVALGWLAMWWIAFLPDTKGLINSLRGTLVVPLPVAAACTWALVCLLFAGALRLRQPFPTAANQDPTGRQPSLRCLQPGAEALTPAL